MVLSSVSEVIEKLGGYKAAAAIAGVKYNAATNWPARRRLPRHAYVKHTLELKRKGFSAPDKLWGMS